MAAKLRSSVRLVLFNGLSAGPKLVVIEARPSVALSSGAPEYEFLSFRSVIANQFSVGHGQLEI